MTEVTDRAVIEAAGVRILSESVVLLWPVDTLLIDARADELASRFTNEHVARLELAAICRWRRDGAITSDVMYELAEASWNLSRLSGGEFTLEPIYRAAQTVWEHLEQLASRIQPGFDPEPVAADPERVTTDEVEAWEAWRLRHKDRARAYFDTVMHDLDRLLSNGQWGIYTFEVHDQLPHDLAEEIFSRTTQQIFDGPYVAGWSLYQYCVRNVGGIAHQGEALVYLADILARALAALIDEYKATDEGSDEAKALKDEIAGAFMLLKGYVYAGVADRGLAGMLRTYPGARDRIIQALQDGVAQLDGYIVGSRDVPWHLGIAHTWQNQKIQDITAAGLVADLLEAIEAEARSSEALSRLR